MNSWISTSDYLPPEAVHVETKIDDENGCRNVQTMKRSGRLWFISDGTYVYYTPTHWRNL